jgi:hypothetical protein
MVVPFDDNINFHKVKFKHLKWKKKQKYNVTLNWKEIMSRELDSVGRTNHYICRGPEFEFWSSHLSILYMGGISSHLATLPK